MPKAKRKTTIHNPDAQAALIGKLVPGCGSTSASIAIIGDMPRTEDGLMEKHKLYYLASPYTDLNKGKMLYRYFMAMRAVKHFVKKGIVVYSPIVHFHPIANAHRLPTDFEFWQHQNHTMLDHCDGLIVYMFPGWEESKGVQDEILYAKTNMKPVWYITEEEIENDKYSNPTA